VLSHLRFRRITPLYPYVVERLEAETDSGVLYHLIHVATPDWPTKIARRPETGRKGPATTPQVLARTGDRTRKGRRLPTPAFRITQR